MRNNFRIYLLLSVLILSSCSELEKREYSGFTEKKAQSINERIIHELIPVDSLNITEEFNGQSLSYLKLNDNFIFAKGDEHILRLNKQDFSGKYTIAIPEGRGPGEIINFNVARFEVGKEALAIFDGKALKTMLYGLNGNFREEFKNEGYQVREMTFANEQIYYFQVMPVPSREYLFYEVERDKSESVVRRKFQRLREDRNILAYNGKIKYHNNSLYFAGYAEPIIRRYDLSGEEVDLVFSRAVIDDFNSENNYETPQKEGDFVAWRYTDNAKFASEDIDVDSNYLYSVRHHNDEAGYKYLDIYTVEDGSYLGSFSLKFYPLYIAVDEEYIYTIEVLGDVRHLIKYHKPEMNF